MFLSNEKYICPITNKRNILVCQEIFLLEEFIYRLTVENMLMQSINSWQIYFPSDKMIFGHFWALWLSILVLNEWFPRFQMGIKYEIKNKHSESEK